MAYFGMPVFGAPPPMWGAPPPPFGGPPMPWGMFPPPHPYGMPPPMSVGGNVGMAAGLYSSALAAPSLSGSVQAPIGSLYASAPALPSVSKPAASSAKGTVGLMLWPNAKTNQLCVTGHSPGTSAAASKIDVGDAIESVNGKSVAGMKPEHVATLMAGELGSFITVRTTGGIEARIERDVSAEEADAASVPGKAPAKKPSAKPSPAKSSASTASSSRIGRKLTQQECEKYGVKFGATWGPAGGGGGGYGYQRFGGIYRMPPTKTVEVRGVTGTQV